MKKISVLLALLLLTGLITFALTPMQAASTDFVFSTNDLPASVKKDDVFVLQVSLTTSVKIAGYLVDIKLNPEYVSLQSKLIEQPGQNPELEETCWGDFLVLAPTLSNATRAAANTYRFTATNANSKTLYPTSGSTGGVIAVLTLKAVKSFSSADFSNAITITPSADNCLKWSSSSSVAASFKTEINIKKADLTRLNNAISAAEAVKQDEKSISSYAALKQALIAAKAFSGTIYADRQSEVDSAAAALETAYTQLKPTLITPLKTAVDKAKALNSKMYTAATFSVVTTALTAAQNELTAAANHTTTDDKLSAATDALNNALKGLEESPYKKLSDLVTKYSSDTYSSDDYTTTTFSAFATELKDAKALLNTNASEAEFTAQYNDLKTAASALRYLLREKIEEAEKYLDAEKYSTKTLTKLQDAITAAKKVADNSSATKADRSAQITALKKAINGLEQSPAITLRALIEKANKLTASDYSIDSYKTLTTAINKANERLNNKVDDTYLEKSITAINNAIANLKESPRITLKNTVKSAKKYSSADYSISTFNTLAAAIETAEELINDSASTEKKMTEYVDIINAAVKALAPKPTGILKQLLETVPTEEAYYTKTSFAPFKQAVSDANNILQQTEPDESEVEAIIERVKNGVAGLESRLGEVITSTLLIDSTLYTADSYAVLADAVTRANDVYSNADATPKEKNDAAIAIESAVDALQYTEREKLRQLVESLKDLDVSDKSNQSAKSFNDAFDVALKVMNNMLTDDATVNDAARQLQLAVEGLVVSIRPQVLDAISRAETIDEETYTEKTYAALSSAVKDAKSVYEDKNATEEQYAMAVKAIDSAIANLEENSLLAFFTDPDIRIYAYVIITMAVIIIVEFAVISVLLKKNKNNRRKTR